MCIKSFYLPEDHSSYTHKIISRKDQLLYNHKKGENYWNTSVLQDFIIDNNLKKKISIEIVMISSRHFMINLILMRLMINLSIKWFLIHRVNLFSYLKTLYRSELAFLLILIIISIYIFFRLWQVINLNQLYCYSP